MARGSPPRLGAISRIAPPYALAKSKNAPPLFKGGDFAATDILGYLNLGGRS